MEDTYQYPLHTYPVKQLRKIVSDHYKIDGYEKMKKAELIKHIKAHQKNRQFDLVKDDMRTLAQLNVKQLRDVIRRYNLYHRHIKGYSKMNRLDLIGIITETKNSL